MLCSKLHYRKGFNLIYGNAGGRRDRLILKLEAEGEAEDAALDATLAKVGNNLAILYEKAIKSKLV